MIRRPNGPPERPLDQGELARRARRLGIVLDPRRARELKRRLRREGIRAP
ncbi:MAG TPA: hypothetical protein VEN82_07230 [Actinomycetota bacterium]|nr:hypothetical protein [Actinomycetota bacterium]